MNILCYGDSNTWGYIPNINGYSKNAIMRQYTPDDCWWHPLTKNHNVIIDGLCGRCIAHENKWLKNRNASKTIYEDLNKYKNLDLIIIQLGTNDCKAEYQDTASEIAKNLQTLINTIKTITNAEILIISPATIKENNKITQKYYVGAEEKSTKLDELYKELAIQENLYFVSGKALDVGEDGEHLTKTGHHQLQTIIEQAVSTIDNENEL